MIITNVFVRLSFLAVLCATSNAQAGSYAGSLQPYFYNDGLYLNPIGGQRTNLPPCATRGTMRLVDDPNGTVYRQKSAMLLGLWLSGRSVTLTGTGTCTTEGDEIMSVVQPG